MKVCTKCKENLPILSYNIKKINKNGTPQYQSICIECNKIYQKEHYIQNKQKYSVKAREWEKEYKKNVYLVLMEIAKDGCSKCQEKDFACLQFDHLEPSKKVNNISSMIRDTKNIELILEEVNKCVILCANCHAKKTAEQFGWYKVVNILG
jgi:hypothetical protein